MNAAYERCVTGSGSVRYVIYRNANGGGEWIEHGFLSIDSEQPIELIHALWEPEGSPMP